jgi:site-specific DNA-methyltransferase (adenine-specific)
MSREVKLGKRAVLINRDMIKVLHSLPPKSVHLIWTDPPYGHDNNSDDLVSRREAALGQGNEALGETRPIMQDDYVSANRLFNALRKAAARVLVPGGTLCVCCGGGGGSEDIQLARWSLRLQRTKGLVFKQIVVWDKGPIGMGWHYRRSYECVLVASKVGAKPLWFDSTKAVENIVRPGAHGVRKILPAKGQHPTEKPPELAELFIRLHTAPGMVVLDPFMGSGSTGVAALRSGRRFLGVELDPVWFNKATKRLRRCVETAGVDPGTEPDPGTDRLKPLWKEKT